MQQIRLGFVSWYMYQCKLIMPFLRTIILGALARGKNIGLYSNPSLQLVPLGSQIYPGQMTSHTFNVVNLKVYLRSITGWSALPCMASSENNKNC